MTEPIKRYAFSAGRPFPDAEGDWVSYADHVTEVERLRHWEEFHRRQARDLAEEMRLAIASKRDLADRVSAAVAILEGSPS